MVNCLTLHSAEIERVPRSSNACSASSTQSVTTARTQRSRIGERRFSLLLLLLWLLLLLLWLQRRHGTQELHFWLFSLPLCNVNDTRSPPPPLDNFSKLAYSTARRVPAPRRAALEIIHRRELAVRKTCRSISE